MRKQYYVYILASQRNGTLYIGVSGNLSQRIDTHRNHTVSSFTAKYSVYRLVYFEVYDNPNEAINREKNVKKWKRDWKIHLIESVNPSWRDLSLEVC